MSTSSLEDVATSGPGSKIEPYQRDRLAIVYIRQSTAYQVAHHQESTKLQYGLKQRAMELGWAAERIVIIDEDLGSSGASIVGRAGFQRLMAEVGMNHVGMILGVEISRLARSCRDWYHLLEVCALFGTLISDTDGVYNPCNYNDRLLLGLKGTMSEAELHILKQRMLAGRRAKAQRGELGITVPMGYERKPSGEVVKDPDEQAQAVVALLFEQFLCLGTVTGVLLYLVRHGLKLPVRVRSGPCKGDLEWRRPSRATLQHIFNNPIYAGAYVYGRHPTDPRTRKAGQPYAGKRGVRISEWEVRLPDRLPAYISWEQFEANQKQMHANRTDARGVVRRGQALLAGLLTCGRCGYRMVVLYSADYHRYCCMHEMAQYGGDLCQSVAGRVVDQAVEEWVLRALEPASLEISLATAAMVEQERAQLAQAWRQRLERAQYEIDRSLRDYQLVEPENRLVKRTLERHLEECLADHQGLQEEHHRFLAKQAAALSEQEREAIRTLATDIPSLWNAATTMLQQKQTIVRQLVERIKLTVVDNTERVLVDIEWAGGHCTNTEVIRPVGRLDQLSYYESLLERIRTLRKEGKTHEEITVQLNKEHWRPARGPETFNEKMINSLCTRLNRMDHTTQARRGHFQPRLRTHEWTIPALAKKIGMPRITLFSWIQQRRVTARKVSGLGTLGVWVIRADAAEVERLRARRAMGRTSWPRDPSHAPQP
jgi:DNA invertase Pin-like site-specific DNA recombinase